MLFEQPAKAFVLRFGWERLVDLSLSLSSSSLCFLFLLLEAAVVWASIVAVLSDVLDRSERMLLHMCD